jgi:hypothetical protein
MWKTGLEREGLFSGADLACKCCGSKQVPAQPVLDFSEFACGTADNPRASLNGTPQQFVLCIGGTQQF